MNTETVIGTLASLFAAVSLLPQLFKIIKERKADDISLLTLSVLFAGLVLWIFYGFLKKDIIIIISNIVSTVINLLIVFFTIRYKKE